MRTDWNNTDVLTYSDINEITDKISELYLIVFDQTISFTEKSIIQFLFSEELEEIEKRIYEMCAYKGVMFEKRNWYNLSTITYKDINRWCVALEMLETDILEDELLYPSDDLFPSDDLYMIENREETFDCDTVYCGEEYYL